MRKWILRTLLVLIALGGGAAAYLYNEARGITAMQVTDDLWMIKGVGSNVGVLRTGAGAVIVDSMTFPMQGRLIEAKAKELTGESVVMIVNTHYHLDHTHGNPGFSKGGSLRIVSTERTLSHLKALDGDAWEGEAARYLPNETFSDALELRIGEKTLRLLHPGRGHTDGDLVVLFVEDRAIHMGDLFFNQHYPNIDLEAGGSVQNWSASIDRAVAIGAFQHVIPGHGDVSDSAGLSGFQRFIEELAAIGAEAATKNASLEKTLQTAQLQTDKGYTEIHFGFLPLGLNRDFVIRRAWEEATGAVVYAPPQ